MALTEVQKMFGFDVIEGAEAFQVRGEGLGRFSDAVIDVPAQHAREEEFGPGGLFGISGETAQRMGRRFLKWDPTFGWVPNTETLIDER